MARNNEEDKKTLLKIEDMMGYAYHAFNQFPKSVRFTIVSDMRSCMDTMLERAVEADEMYFKKTTLRDLDIANAKLKHYLLICDREHYFSHHTFEVWNDYLTEIGRLVGARRTIVEEWEGKKKASKG